MVAAVLLALLIGWVVFGRPAGDEIARPSATTGPPSARPPTADPQTPPTANSSPVPRSDHPGKGVPTRILLPQLAVSARVIPIAATGRTLTPPSNPRVVGWWSAGARPGAAIGSAVLTAHTLHAGGGAFDDLDKLRVGAIVTVLTSTGRIAYTATSVTNYPKQSLAQHAATLFDQTVPGRLVLVTCEDWNGKTYLSNAVVIAAPHSSR